MHWFSFISHIMPHVASKRRSESERPLEIMEKSNEGIVRSEVSALSHSSFHLFIPYKWFYCDCCRNFCPSSGPHHSRWDLKALTSSLSTRLFLSLSHWNNTVSGFVCSYLFGGAQSRRSFSDLLLPKLSEKPVDYPTAWSNTNMIWSLDLQGLGAYFSSCAMAAICSTRSWWAARSLSKASCFLIRALISISEADS